MAARRLDGAEDAGFLFLYSREAEVHKPFGRQTDRIA